MRSTEFAPSQSVHAVSLELSRILDFIGRQGEASRVIQWNMRRFPDEWKLVLERVNQLFRENRALDAYHLCIDSLRRDPTAGRLWSSFIQIAHQYFFLSFSLTHADCSAPPRRSGSSTRRSSSWRVPARSGARARASSSTPRPGISARATRSAASCSPSTSLRNTVTPSSRFLRFHDSI